MINANTQKLEETQEEIPYISEAQWSKKKPCTPQKTIEDALLELKKIVKETRGTNLAYFPVLYLYVTKSIQKETSKHKKASNHKDDKKEFSPFDDNERMKRLDVIFANRYINAYYGWKNNKEISKSWEIAFKFAVEDTSSMIMQHLLLGMNAHINLDLGIATVDATSFENDESKAKCTYKGFNSIVDDFKTINKVLAALTKTVEDCLASNSFVFRLISKYGKGKEAIIANFSMQYARSAAWNFASEYRYKHHNQTIEDRDNEVHDLSVKMTKSDSKIVNLLITLGAITESIKGKKFVDNMITMLDKELVVKFDEIEKEIEIENMN